MLKGQFTHSLHCHPAQQGSGAVGGLPVKHLEWKKQLSGVVYDVTKTDLVGLPGAQPLPRTSAGLRWQWLSFMGILCGKEKSGMVQDFAALVGMCVQGRTGTQKGHSLGFSPKEWKEGFGVGPSQGGRRMLFLAEICLHWSQNDWIKNLHENMHLKK